MNITAIIFAAVVVGGVGILIGFFLGVSGEKFKVEVDEREEWRIKGIEKRIKALNTELYNAVDQELNKKGQDSKKVDELTEKLVDLQEELKVFRDRKAKVEDLKTELEWFLKKLETIDDLRVKRNEGIGHGAEIYFREDIYEEGQSSDTGGIKNCILPNLWRGIYGTA